MRWLLIVLFCLVNGPLLAKGDRPGSSPPAAVTGHLPAWIAETPPRANEPAGTARRASSRPAAEDTSYAQYPRAKPFKSRIVAIALCAGLGFTAAHRYYMGARKFALAPGYLGLNVVMWFMDLVALCVNGQDSMDRFLYNDRFFAGVDL
ncbi:MAG: TM2 domain-containing protein [Bacteroidetes bacterium]|nr:TM2 domain-containing protein [Bacteroidota bacterium]